jgi:hypothetical protein
VATNHNSSSSIFNSKIINYWSDVDDQDKQPVVAGIALPIVWSWELEQLEN